MRACECINYSEPLNIYKQNKLNYVHQVTFDQRVEIETHHLALKLGLNKAITDSEQTLHQQSQSSANVRNFPYKVIVLDAIARDRIY